MQEKYNASSAIVNYAMDSAGNYTGTISVSEILHFNDGVAATQTIATINNSLLTMDGEIGALSLQVGQIEANYISAETADLKYATIVNLNATNATIHDLQADYGTFKSLTTQELAADYEYISALNADVANITTILAGNIGTGQLQAVHLTASNAVIDEQLVKSLMAQYITVADLRAGVISTDKFSIESDDGGISLAGNTQQFKDANGVVRVQIGQDAQGDFTFLVLDEEGSGTLIDAEGIHAAAIGDGLVIDRMVANDAAINPGKIDLVSMNQAMDDAGATLSASHIWFDEADQSLNVKLGTMTDQIESTLFLTIITTDNLDDTTTLTAHLYRAGEDVTSEYPEEWFSWSKRDENQIRTLIGHGTSITIDNDDYEFFGSVIATFQTLKDGVLVLSGNKPVASNNTIRIAYAS